MSLRPVQRLIEIAPDRAHRMLDPELLPADVVRLSTAACIRPAKGPVMAARAAASAALAAGAGVSATAAMRIRIEQHWRPGGEDIVIIPDMVPRPMPLLPFMRHAVETYLDLRGNPSSGPLLASASGHEVIHARLRYGLTQVGVALGLRGNRLWDRLHHFFMQSFDDEPNNEAVAYLTGRLTRFSDSPGAPQVPMAELRRILSAAHPLSAPARTYFNASSSYLARQTGNLPKAASRVKQFSLAFRTDSIVRRLAEEVWPDDEAARETMRAERKALHFPHLHALWLRGEIKPVEVGFLLRRAPDVARSELVRHGVPRRPTSIDSKRAWRCLLDESWRKRPQGEAFADFCRRLMRTYGPFQPGSARQVLKHLGLIKRRRGRPRKARASRAAA